MSRRKEFITEVTDKHGTACPGHLQGGGGGGAGDLLKKYIKRTAEE